MDLYKFAGIDDNGDAILVEMTPAEHAEFVALVKHTA